MIDETMMHVGSLAGKTEAQVVVQPGATVRAVLSAIRASNVLTAFIVDEIGTLCGSISNDELERTEPDSKLESLPAVAHEESTKFVMVDAPLVEVFHMMNENNVNVLPVVNRNKILHGFISLNELRDHLSPERIYPHSLEEQDTDKNVERHVARYRFASQFIRESDLVLDGACGAGYGSAILAEKAAAIIGVDISEEAIHYARDTYGQKKINFLCSDLNALSFKSRCLDAVVFLETLEHLPFDACKDYMKSLRMWLKPGGVIVASSPMLRYNNGKPFITNPYHVNEMPREALLNFFVDNFPGFAIHYFHQKQNAFLPLTDEDTGFCVVVARKK